MTLYQIKEEYRALLEAIECGIVPEEAINDTLEGIEGELNDKVDSIACFIKELRADITAIKHERDALQERLSAKVKKVEYLTDYLTRTLTELGVSKMETARNQISFRKSTCVTILGEEEFIEWAQKEAPELLKFAKPEISLTAVKNAIKGGRTLEGVSIDVNNNIQLK